MVYAPEVLLEAEAVGARIQGDFEYALVVERGPRAGLAFILNPGVTTIGRSAESNIFLDDVTVSRDHARLELEEGRLTVEDAGSTNGTYVNGARLEKALLNAGDEVIVGKYHLIVARGDG